MEMKELHKYVSKKEPNICQIVCIKDGKKIYSDTWNGYSQNDCVHVMSVTKSVVALLIGICVDKGLINSIDKGVGTAGYGLCFSADDLARLGLLCLNNGTYEDKQIVSSSWLQQIMSKTHRCGGEFANMCYGRLWWIIDDEKGIFAAIGNSGNVIYVNRSNNFVAGVTAYFKPTVLDRIDFIRQYLDT